MLKRCKPYRASLGVRAIMEDTTHADMLGGYTQDCWHTIKNGNADLTYAVASSYHVSDRPPLVVLSIFTHKQGFAYAYFDTAVEGGAGLIVGGHTPLFFEPPMPITPEPYGAVAIGVVGMVVLRHDLRSIMLRVHEDARRGGPISARPGWEYPSRELMHLHTQASPDGYETLSLAQCNPEDN